MPVLGNMIAWLTTHAVRLAIIGALSMLLGVMIYNKGQTNSALKCASANAQAVKTELDTHNEIHDKVSKMPLIDVDKSLDEFMRPTD